MARSGSGVWSAPAGIPVVSGTTISSTVFNNLITDIGTEITGSMPVAGTAPMTGALRAVLGSVSAPGYTFVGDTDTGIYSPGANQAAIVTGGTAAVTFSSTQTSAWTAKAVGKAFDVDAITSVASASTCDIGAAATSEVLITGTTTITAFGTSAAGIRRRGRFDGALTLTHNATSLILPGRVNITTAANDSFEALSLGSGNWIVTDYRQQLAGVGGMVRVSSGTASAAATLDIPLPTGYRAFKLILGPGFAPATDSSLLGLRFSYDNGSSFAATGYGWVMAWGTTTAVASSAGAFTSADTSTWTTTAITMTASNQDSSTSSASTYEIDIIQGGASLNPSVFFRSYHLWGDGSRNGFATGSANHSTLDVIDSVRLLYNTGNLNGQWILYGVL